MQGQRYLDKLKRRAARLRKTRVVFPGYVTGERKAAFFALADLFVFPSRFESYGLTLLEALASGLPAVCLDHVGARSVMREEFGAIAKSAGLGSAIARLLADEPGLKRMGQAARQFASTERFSDRAAVWREFYCLPSVSSARSAMARFAISISVSQQPLI